MTSLPFKMTEVYNGMFPSKDRHDADLLNVRNVIDQETREFTTRRLLTTYKQFIKMHLRQESYFFTKTRKKDWAQTLSHLNQCVEPTIKGICRLIESDLGSPSLDDGILRDFL